MDEYEVRANEGIEGYGDKGYLISHNIFIVFWPIPLACAATITCNVVSRGILALHEHADLMNHNLFISVWPWQCNYEQVMTHEVRGTCE